MSNQVVILQDAIMPYRKPFYNALGRHYELCVLHSGRASVESGDRYRESIVPLRRRGSFAVQAVTPALVSLGPLEAVIAMFDLRWPATLWAAWRADAKRRLLWGHRYSQHTMANAARDVIMRRFDGFIQYGEEDVAAMVARGIDRERIFFAPNTIDVVNHTDCSRERKRGFLFVGRLQPRKRLEELLRAFADILGSIPAEMTLDLVGDGEIRSELEALARELGIASRVVFHGAITDAGRLKTIFSPACAYVSPDNVGLGVLHAFAYGVPVITGEPRATREIGFRHGPEFHNLHPGENSLIFADGDELRRQMVTMATDSALAQRLGAAAYVHYKERRSIKVMVDGFRRAIEWPSPLSEPSPDGLA